MDRRKVRLAYGVLQALVFQGIALAECEPHEVQFFVRRDHLSNEFIGRKGILVKRPHAPATVLLLHGYGVDKYTMSPLRIFLKNYNCFSFDFRAHGKHAPDQESTLGYDEVNDVFGAVDYIRADPDLRNKPLIVIGFSMGAVSAIEAQSLDSKLFTAMFLDTPFSSSLDVLRRGMQKVKFGFFGYQFYLPGSTLLESYAFNPYVQPFLQMLLRLKSSLNTKQINTFAKLTSPAESIKKVTVPCFFVVTKKDEKVSVNEVKQVYENHPPGYKRLWVANGREHCDAILYNPEKYEHEINQFIEDILKGKGKRISEEIIYDQEA